MERSARTDLLYHALYLVPLSVLAVLVSLRISRTTDGVFGYVLVSLSSSLVLLLFYSLRMKGRIILTGLLLELLLIIVLIRPAGERLAFFSENIRFLPFIALSVVLFFSVFLMQCFMILKGIIALLILSALLFCLFTNTSVSDPETALSFFVIALVVSEAVQHFWKKQGDTDPKKHLVFISPFLLVIFLLVLFIRSPEDPYDWYFFRKIYAGVSSAFDRISVSLFTGFGDSYESQKIGFSENGFIPGTVEKLPKDVLEVRFENGVSKHIYLTGKVFDTFNGKAWEEENKSDMNFTMMDVIETHAAVSQYDPQYFSDYLRRERISIAYRHFRSKTIFTPLKALIKPDTFQDLNYTFSGGSLKSDILISYRDSYELQYYRTNRDQAIFEAMASSAEQLKKESWESSLLGFNLEHRSEYSFNSYRSYKQALKAIWLKPVELTPRTQAFLDKALDGADSDYEKLLRLEELFSGYTYNNSPGSIPDDVDTPGKFLDYFLFENPQGFCSHFATAFVLLSRAAGIPARYCQGFYVPRENGDTVNVTSAMAHAWPEAYIENVGWIIFEPTPGFRVYTGWTPSKRTEDDSPKDAPEVRPDIPEPVLPEPVPVIDTPEEEETKGPGAVKILLISLAVVIISLILLMLFDLKHLDRVYRSSDNNGRIRIMFRRSMRLLSFMNVSSIRSGETLAEYRERALKYLPEDCLWFIGHYEEVLYRESPVTDDLVRASEDANKRLKEELKKERPYAYPWLLLRSRLRQ